MKKKQTIDQLKKEGLVTTADKITVPESGYTEESYIGVHLKNHKYSTTDKKTIQWITEIENYCSQQGILPSELIDFYKRKGKVVRKEDKAEKPPQNPKQDKSNWRKDYINKKIGRNE